ncbi:MAG: Mammalian cell entry related domain protein [Solirubrobacterales bacterium]|nr:Mammalian cell entry related domain protein [Solirubrobacterales bacterium]
MRPRRATGSLAANPVLVGAVTVLVVVVAVFLAYNANSGLPFVPTYHVTAVVPDAARLTPGAAVRISGHRVGQLTEITPIAGASGRTSAQLSLQVDQTIGPLPVDTKVLVRAASALGLKYVQLVPGTSARTVREGGVLPTQRTTVGTELDTMLSTFDAPTRRALRSVIGSTGDALAGRGGDLNGALAGLAPLLGHLSPVAAVLAAPGTRLGPFMQAADAAAAAFAPVAGPLNHALQAGATTFDAIAREPLALSQTLSTLATTERRVSVALAEARPVLQDTVALLRAARPGTRLLHTAAGGLSGAAAAATPALRRTVPVAKQLDTTLADVGQLVRNPQTGESVRKLGVVLATLRPALTYILPFQTSCNYLALWTRNLNSAISEGDRNGHWFRFAPVVGLADELDRATPADGLHVNPYPHLGQTGSDCEAGNEPFLPGRQLGNIPGDQGLTEDTSAATTTVQP